MERFLEYYNTNYGGYSHNYQQYFKKAEADREARFGRKYDEAKLSAKTLFGYKTKPIWFFTKNINTDLSKRLNDKEFAFTISDKMTVIPSLKCIGSEIAPVKDSWIKSMLNKIQYLYERYFKEFEEWSENNSHDKMDIAQFSKIMRDYLANYSPKSIYYGLNVEDFKSVLRYGDDKIDFSMDYKSLYEESLVKSENSNEKIAKLEISSMSDSLIDEIRSMYLDYNIKNINIPLYKSPLNKEWLKSKESFIKGVKDDEKQRLNK
jgi:hypothetical protein